MARLIQASIRIGLVALALLTGFPARPAAGAAQEAQDEADRPDFSKVTSKTIANKLVREGRLVKIHFFPAELGGPDDPENIGYIPTAVAEARVLLIGTLRRFAEEGLFDRLEVVPDYRGDSLVPTRIHFKTWLGDEAAGFGGTLQVW